MRGPQAQVPVLAGAVTVLSMVTKNVGALAMIMPVAAQVARRTGTPLSLMLMPMAFGSLIGGIVTLVGTSPNILVSKVRDDITGEPFGMFDYTPVGLAVAGAGLLFLSVGYRLLPVRRAAGGSMEAAFSMEEYSTEARIPEGSAFAGRTVADLEALGEGARVATVIRERFRRHVPRPDWELRAGDVLLLTGEPEDLERVVARGGLRLTGEEAGVDAVDGDGDNLVVEGVVTADSPLLGRTVAEARLRRAHGLGLLAVSRSGQRLSRRLRRLRLEVGDVLILKAPRDRLGEAP
jgi:di/tricarboxylate transporter